jgi:ABC-type proline/glycine betaine transport system permease subunit
LENTKTTNLDDKINNMNNKLKAALITAGICLGGIGFTICLMKYPQQVFTVIMGALATLAVVVIYTLVLSMIETRAKNK